MVSLLRRFAPLLNPKFSKFGFKRSCEIERLTQIALRFCSTAPDFQTEPNSIESVLDMLNKRQPPKWFMDRYVHSPLEVEIFEEDLEETFLADEVEDNLAPTNKTVSRKGKAWTKFSYEI